MDLEGKIWLIKFLVEAILLANNQKNCEVLKIKVDSRGAIIHVTIQGYVLLKTINMIGDLFGDREVLVEGDRSNVMILSIDNNNIKGLIDPSECD